MVRRAFAIATVALAACGGVASVTGSAPSDAGADSSPSSSGSATSSSSGATSSSGGATSSSGGATSSSSGSSSADGGGASTGDASVADGSTTGPTDDGSTSLLPTPDASIPDGAFGSPVVVVEHVLVPPVALASNGVDLFWVDQNGLLWTAPAQGGAPQNVTASPVDSLLSLGPASVYVSAPAGVNSAIESGPANGALPSPILSIDGALAASTIAGDRAYWITNIVSPDGGAPPTATVQTSLLSGGGTQTLASFPYETGPGSIAATSSLLFLVIDGQLLTLPFSGGMPSPVPNVQLDCQSLLASGDSVVCAASPLLLIAPNGEMTRIALETNNVTSMAADDANVYWVNDAPSGSVVAAPKQGGQNYVIAYDPSPTAVAVDDAAVYWGDVAGNILRAPKQ